MAIQGPVAVLTGGSRGADMAIDFKDHGIAVISIWMGTLLTQRVREIVAAAPEKLGHVLDDAETPELTGHVMGALR